MIIDSHQHFWNYNPIRDNWIDESMQVIRRDFLPKDLKPILEAHHIDGCIAVQADQSEKETLFLLQCARKNPFVKGVIGWVDLKADNVGDRLAFFTENKSLKGIRHILQSEPTGFMGQKKFKEGISKLNKYGLAYDILVYGHQLTEAVQLVGEFPDQTFILDHMGKPNLKKGDLSQWSREIQKLAKLENVYCKVSGMVTETDWNNRDKTDFRYVLDTVFESFGIERTLFGSDWPVCLLAAKYSEVYTLVDSYASQLSKEEKDMLYYKNAVKAYRLNL
ncbi:amidohydrolase family protein [Maribacter sp. 2304DJ31-5]|uniref:amidohydrolase family protein n=1 Tax=Maribacter sp. 2304DJ31-5 TaxID=3386273 RepID=UPI0039BCCCE7